MKSWKFRTVIFISALSAGSLQCEESELENQCADACGSEYCGADASEAFFDNCRDACVERQNSAEQFAGECGEKHQGVLKCITGLSCEEIDVWVKHRGQEGVYPCSEVSQKFAVVCPGIWFAP